MKYSTPEEQGIRSEHILDYVLTLEENRLATHNILMMRHGKVIYEAYWEPFHKDFLHRSLSIDAVSIYLFPIS